MDDACNTTWGLVDLAFTDDGELDGLDNSTCFMLGAEWNMFCDSIKNPEPFEVMIDLENVDRLVKTCERYGRACEHEPFDGYVIMKVSSSSQACS